MRELGHGDRYSLRFRHLVLQPSEKVELPSYNQFYILIEEAQDVSVKSELGTFDLSLDNVNEMLYEHQGLVEVKNKSDSIKHIRFIQVIPKKHK
ncbi:MAG: hypothetical protein IT233_07725 [Bacteroidia bacterium]|nr:hypothetical protein [Bacteroidia bacterium]